MTEPNELIVSVSGIRGVVGRGLTPESALAFAAALGTCTQGGRVVVSRDGRPSGSMLRHAVLAGLLSAGCDVDDLGIAPTPTCGLAVRRLGAAGAMMITASHNPAPWNGLKLFGADGRVLPATEGAKVKELFDRAVFRRAPWDRLGRLSECTQATAWHRDRVLELVDTRAVRARRLKVFLDANGGAGGPLGVALLEALGCEVIAHGCSADGHFAHEPEPLAENLRAVCPLVARAGAAVGLVLDPDSDRLALIDESGRYIGEELTLALAVLYRLGQQKGPVVVNMSTSRLVEDLARRFGVACQRSAVGEANVVDRMQEVNAVIGGEGNGGVIDPRVGGVRDPFIGMGLILSLLASTGKPLSALVGELPAYHIVKDKYTVDRARLPEVLAALSRRWPEARLNTLDGLRLDWEDRWIHVRPSNTEPIVRVIAEAPQREQAERLCREAGDLLTADRGA
ncbi:MAG: phosphoglucosamine mutase [Gemmataceae bacterium]|nr:phosphoglucosamine mutase [Gemmataceae bacterium]